jgi:hypothetical protein
LIPTEETLEEARDGTHLLLRIGLAVRLAYGSDFTLYPEVALALRIARRKPGLEAGDSIGPKIAAWMRRMEALPCAQKTWPPHWK